MEEYLIMLGIFLNITRMSNNIFFDMDEIWIDNIPSYSWNPAHHLYSLLIVYVHLLMK